MKFRQFTRAGAKFNEDSCYICKDFGFVIDGATGLTNCNITNGKTEAQWFSCKFKEYLMDSLKDTTKSLSNIVEQGIVEIDNEYNKFAGADNSKIKPSAAIAIFRLSGLGMEYFVLGDFSIIVNIDDKINIITSRDLEKFDNQSKQILKAVATENNINVIDAVPLVENVLIKQRLLKNTVNGYWILSDDTKAVNYAICGTITSKIKQIVVVSDGFSQVYELFKFMTA